MRLLLTTCLSLLLVAPAVATDAPADGSKAPAVAPAATAAVRDPNEKICRTHRPIGTNRAERLCRTRAQIEREREHAEKELDRQLQRDRFQG